MRRRPRWHQRVRQKSATPEDGCRHNRESWREMLELFDEVLK
jgi:hypothetical protein